MAEKLTSRERVLKALNFEEPDRVPIDLGSTRDSSIVKEEYNLLRKHLEMQPKEVPFTSQMMRTVNVDEELLDYFDIDFRGIYPGPTKKREWIDERTYKDDWGIVRVQPEGSYYFDQKEFPLSGEISISDIRSYPWPDPDSSSVTEPLRKQLADVRNNTDKAAVVGLPAPIVHTSQYLRGFEDWYIDCAADTKLIDALFDSVLEVNYTIARRILEEVGNEADIAMCADDLGTQDGLQFSPVFFREHIKPRLKKYFDMIHSTAPNIKLLFHSCGGIESVLSDLIEIGVDIINPVQVSANGMDSKILSKKYSGGICFWGAIDTQYVLWKGNPANVKEEVEKRINDLGKGGGYIVSAVHNIQPGVPPENIVTMFEHAKTYSSEFYSKI
jgi:uroporphyrinogen decarboxylase